MLMYRLYNATGPSGVPVTERIPTNVEDFPMAGANTGLVIGQFASGYAADAFGQKAVCE